LRAGLFLAAFCDGSQAVVFKILKTIGSSLDGFHLPVEAFGDAMVFIVNRHRQGIGSLHNSRVRVRVVMDLKPLVLSFSIRLMKLGINFLAFLAVIFRTHDLMESLHLWVNGFGGRPLFQRGSGVFASELGIAFLA
jgi:hypothetical protein